MRNNRPLPHITESGIRGVGLVPYGIHLCHFYPTRQDLVDSLVPYFTAGLSNNERCLWITAPPLPADEARAELGKAVAELAVFVKNGQIRILDATEWYTVTAGTDANDVIKLWLQEEEKALADGYQGLRLSGNTSFLTPGDWDNFMDYEGNVDHAFQDRRIVALCSYSYNHCRATGILEVIQNHQYTLGRRDVSWEILREDFTSAV